MDFSYIAGFFDGEGSVSEQPGPTHGWVASIAQSTRQAEVLRAIQVFLEPYRIKAALYVTPATKKRAGMSRLNIVGLENCMAFLRFILPHLHVKAAAATRALIAMEKRAAYWNERKTLLRTAILEYRPGMSTSALAQKYGIKWKRLKINLAKAGIVIPDKRPCRAFTLPCGHLIHTAAVNRNHCDVCHPADPKRQSWISTNVEVMVALPPQVPESI